MESIRVGLPSSVVSLKDLRLFHQTAYIGHECTDATLPHKKFKRQGSDRKIFYLHKHRKQL